MRTVSHQDADPDRLMPGYVEDSSSSSDNESSDLSDAISTVAPSVSDLLSDHGSAESDESDNRPYKQMRRI